MKPVYKPKRGIFDSLAVMSLDAAEKTWAKEQRKFLDSIRSFNREELLKLLCDFLMEISSLENLLEIAEKRIDVQSEHFEKLKKLNDKRRSEYADTSKNAVKIIRALEKEVEYTQNISEGRGKKLNANVQVLDSGRVKGNQVRTASAKAKEAKLLEAIRQYFQKHPDHSNKQIVALLSQRGFIGQKLYTPTTLTKSVAVLAAKVRKEFPGR